MGRELIDQLVEATGLPQEIISSELLDLISKAGIAPESITLDQLRELLAHYVQDVLLEVKAQS